MSALVTPAWLHRHRHDPKVRLVEVAGIGQDDLQAYRAGHVPGALGWLWKDTLWDSHRREFPAPEEFARRCAAAGIANDTTVVFYGEPAQFGIYAWWVFTYCGHRRVRVLDGGRAAWRAAGYPLFTAPPSPVAPAVYAPARRVERMRVHRDRVLRSLGGDTLILDGRSHEEYRGERVGAPGTPDTGALRYGRIPGAKHVFFEDLLDENRCFRPVAELRRLLEPAGVAEDREIITYCRMSHRATVLYFVLTQLLGLKKVRVYDGSWTEWGNLVDAPIER